MQLGFEGRVIAAPYRGRFFVRTDLGQQLIRQKQFLALGQFGELGGESGGHSVSLQAKLIFSSRATTLKLR